MKKEKNLLGSTILWAASLVARNELEAVESLAMLVLMQWRPEQNGLHLHLHLGAGMGRGPMSSRAG